MSGATAVDELLMAHAAGRLPEPVSLVVATHLALSPPARARYRRYESIGGVLLERLEPAPLEDGAWERLLGRLGMPEDEVAATAPPPAAIRLPRPLRDYLPGSLDELRWRSYGSAAVFELSVKAPGYRTMLLRVRGGGQVPQHTHEGSELTLVLEGAFRDEVGRYARGDLAIADSSVVHRPVADAGEDCLCLTVTDAPLRLTGLFGRMLNPFVRF